MSKTIVDPSPGTGVYQGDLRYGRCNGMEPVKNKDFAGEHNQPIMPLVLVKQRDPHVWIRDTKVKKVKNLPGSQHGVNYVMEAFRNSRLSNQATLRIGSAKM